MRFKYDSKLPPLYQLFPKMDTWYDVSEVRKIRSINQNKYYWGVCIPIIGEWMGEDKEFVHEVLKSLFLEKKVIKNPFDKRRKIILHESTTDLNTKEFKEFIDKIREKFKDLRIPAPDDNSSIDAYNYYNKLDFAP